MQKNYTWQPGSIGQDVPLWMNSGTSTYYYVVDGNKNVMAMVDGTGALAAEYEYGQFGEILSKYGAMADVNPFRFSSEFYDVETGLIYYNYRYYSPELRRWISKDPIGEAGGVNLYGFVGNNPVNYWDWLGLRTVMFTINFNFTTKVDDKVWESARNEFERIMNDCHSSCDKCKAHKLLYNWVHVSREPNNLGRVYEEVDGFNNNPANIDAHRAFWGFYPIGINLYVGESSGGGGGGDNWWGHTSTINLRKVLEGKSNDATNAEILGQTLAHEILFHNIGRYFDFQGSTDVYNVDGGGGWGNTKLYKPGAKLTKEVCKKICNKLDITTP